MIKQISNMTDYEQTMNEVIEDYDFDDMTTTKKVIRIKKKLLSSISDDLVELQEEDHSTH